MLALSREMTLEQKQTGHKYASAMLVVSGCKSAVTICANTNVNLGNALGRLFADLEQ